MGRDRRSKRNRVALIAPSTLVILAGAAAVWWAVPASPVFNVPPPPGPGRAPIRRPPPKPLFSKQYVEAQRDILAMEAPEAAALEAKLQNEPNDYRARLRLLAYYGRADIANESASRRRVLDLTAWLIQNEPGSEILSSPYAARDGDLATLWEQALASHPRQARTWWNAAQFFDRTNPIRYRECVERAVELDPANEHYCRALGGLYANVMLDGQDSGARDRLLTTNNFYVLEAATRLIQSRYIQTVMLDQPDTNLRDWAARLFHRARELDPGLDVDWVLPPVKPEFIGMLTRPPVPAPPPHPAKMRRLLPSDFPELPETVAKVLTARGCTIPQSRVEGRTNVIRGEFFETGVPGWAVICSVRFQSELLVFRGDADTTPVRMGPRHPDSVMGPFEGGATVCGNEIRTVARKYIMEHYRAYGGPKPPPIDHDGIDVGILEKASVVWYWFNGKWLTLQGAD